jgi:hypothetical protein
MKMTLWEIDKALLECIDTDTGEILDFERLDELQLARETKLENIALYIKNLQADAEAIREEEKALAERRKAKENRAASLKEYLSKALDGNAFETARVGLSFRRSQNVNIEDEFSVVEYLEKNNVDDALTYSLPKISKTIVGQLLKAGTEIPGAVLQENNNLQIK